MKNFALSIALLYVSFASFSQDVILEDGSTPEAEFHTVMNPLDSNNIVLATQNNFGVEPRIKIYYTNDFGETWNTSSYEGLPNNFFASGDPVLSFDADGNVYLVNLAISETSQGPNTVLSKSTDGGATWSQVATIATSGTDKPWMAIDRYESSPYNGNIYVPVVLLNLNFYTLDENYQTTNSSSLPDGNHLPSVVVKKDGTVFTSNVALNNPNNKIYVQEHSNGGTNLVHSTQVISFPDYTYNAPNVSMRFQPCPYLAIDNSGGTHDGRLYLSYTASETSNPGYFEVFLTYSDDNGVNWSTPKAVHSSQQNETQQFYSSIFVNDAGAVILDWYDRKNHSNANKMTDFFLGISYDGGDNFTEVQLNSESSDFDNVIPSSGDFGVGEYHQLVATNHTALSFWSDGRTNDEDLNIYMAKVSLDASLSVDEMSVVNNKVSVSSLYPNPGSDDVFSDLELNEAAKIKYDVINISGQVVKSSEWREFTSGKHQLNLNFSGLSQGVYTVSIKTKKGYFKNMRFVKH